MAIATANMNNGYPIKVRFNGDVRDKFHTRLLEPYDGTPVEQISEEDLHALAHTVRAFGREKTNVVVENESERRGVIHMLDKFRDQARWSVWGSTNKVKAVDRVRRELDEAVSEGDVGGDDV